MPKSKKQLEHTHTFIDENLSGHTHTYISIIEKVQLVIWGQKRSNSLFHRRMMEESIISGLWYKNGSTTRTLPRHSDQIHYPT